MAQTAEQLSNELYDAVVPDWDGEVACGTGRAPLRLADEGVDIVGTDRLQGMGCVRGFLQVSIE